MCKCPFVLSLYTLGRLVTLSCEISDQSSTTCVNSHYRVRGQSMVCVHTQRESENAFQRYSRVNLQNGRRIQPEMALFHPQSLKTPP